MQEWISIRSHDRLVQFGEQVELVIGDAVDTIPKFIESNPQLGISMLVLDFDLYEPTKVALDYFLPRMPKGALVVFDELFDSRWPGETKAFMETINIQSTRLKKHDYDAHTIWFELD